MIDNLKPYGAFIENTIRPLFEEVRYMLDIAQESGLNLTEKNLSKVLNMTGRWYLINTLIESAKTIIIVGIVSYTAWLICKWTT